MTSPVAITPRPLTHKDCAGLHWRSPSDFGFTDHVPSVLVGASELSSVTLEMPWYFAQANGKWHALVPLRSDAGLKFNHVPFLLRMYPFTLLPDANSFVLGIWQDPDCIGETGHPIYDGAQLHPRLEPVANAFSRFVKGLDALHKIGAALHRAGVLQPTPQQASDTGQLFQTDEDALRALPADTLSELAKSGVLGAAYAQLLSRTHLKRTARPKVASQPQNTPVTREEDRAFLDALTDDLLEGAELKPGALAP
jgi:hypothetical protein